MAIASFSALEGKYSATCKTDAHIRQILSCTDCCLISDLQCKIEFVFIRLSVVDRGRRNLRFVRRTAERRSSGLRGCARGRAGVQQRQRGRDVRLWLRVLGRHLQDGVQGRRRKCQRFAGNRTTFLGPLINDVCDILPMFSPLCAVSLPI